MPILEGAWNCAQCTTKNISGTLKECPLCGDPHNDNLDPSEGYFLPTDARVMTNADELRRANSGPIWNCGKCNTPNDGDIDTCGSCKQPRDSDDFVSPVTRYVSGVDAQGSTLSNPAQLETDWVNATLQRSDKLQPLADSPVIQPVRTLHSRDLPRSGKPQYENNTSNNRPVFRLGGTALLSRVKTPRVMLGIGLGMVLGVLLFGARTVYVNYFATETVDLTVSSLSWEREVEVEEFRTLTRQDWSVPGDGRVLSSSREIRSYRQVLDHYETKTRQVPETKQTGTRTESYACGSTTVNNGNGSFSQQTTYCNRSVPVYTTTYRTESYQDPVYRDEPIYDTKYTYEVDRWVTDYFDRASGQSGPYWPKPELEGERQRVGDERRSSYVVILIDEEGRAFKREVGESTWSHARTGMMIEGEQTRKGTLKDIDWQPAD